MPPRTPSPSTAKLKQRLAAAEEEWFMLNEELEEEMAKQAEAMGV